jgi:putative lipoic acid-binding regulatory protein
MRKKENLPAVVMMAQAGTFFNPIPERNDEDDNDNDTEDDDNSRPMQTIRNISSAPLPAGQGFGNKRPKQQQQLSMLQAQKLVPPGNQKPFVGIGPPLNDVTKPEYDDQGYTLFADERTGVKSRVFEALVDYPCAFTMKIVGQTDEGRFVPEIVAVVAESCQVNVEDVPHSVRTVGSSKWTSVTVQAPVQSAEMLYQLYEVVDKDPRVKFKF